MTQQGLHSRESPHMGVVMVVCPKSELVDFYRKWNNSTCTTSFDKIPIDIEDQTLRFLFLDFTMTFNQQSKLDAVNVNGEIKLNHNIY
jgi:hypothetical protein